MTQQIAPLSDIGFETDLENQQFFIPVAFPLPEHTAYRSGEHFQIYQEIATGHFHWAGLNDYSELIRSEAYTELLEAGSDCIFWLHRFSGFGYEDSHTHTHELALPTLQQDRTEPDFIVTLTPPNIGYIEKALTAKAAPLSDAEVLAKVREAFQGFVSGSQYPLEALEGIGMALGEV